jgi:hypothetical protein
MRENPGPEVAVIPFIPAQEAPIKEQAEEISSSIWMNRPPTWGILWAALSMISEAGVMG